MRGVVESNDLSSPQIKFPAPSSSFGNHACKYVTGNSSSSIPPLLSGVFFMLVSKIFVIVSLLALCGDVESNPGPKKEAKPDKAKIMQDKVLYIS
jgi:hypothetical protein